MIRSATRYDSRLGAGPMKTASSASSTWSASRSASEYTATVAMPIRFAVLMTRQAISPRFAINIFLNIARSQRNVPVLAPRVVDLLVAQHHERAADPAPGLVRLDDVVDVAARAGDEGVGEFGLVLGLAGRQLGRIVLLV